MTRTRAITALTALTAATGACAKPALPPSPATVDTVYVVDTVRVVTESEVDAELEDQIARLQIDLLERDVQIRELTGQLDGTRQELVRNLAKLQSQATRAEAASGMAEADIAIQTLQQLPGGTELPELAGAEALIAESTREFDSENYGGALYLATEARSLARGGQSRLGGGGGSSLRDGESLFATPVPLRTVSRSNVRGGPGLDFDVLFTLEGGIDLVGQSHTSQWVRVRDAGGQEGWIFHTLVGGRAP